ncbi:hypothetical protein [Vibrio parahaemolyticus]|uniref:hypothetical protein n=3 Tax=Vibrio parahaemolyticus TaxID=670 RepID=UPI0004069646|nr:hypothetical protein [Vibrio parahaemolyticus]EGR3302723.1 hypothetical protein [Vibrio parahaemolyticus]ELJ8839943.1 hypothetical protein [Vibrio parahaemolyticus]KHF09015.1 hypothetical protein PO77_06160 [Vibrio parahaemolyticus]
MADIFRKIESGDKKNNIYKSSIQFGNGFKLWILSISFLSLLFIALVPVPTKIYAEGILDFDGGYKIIRSNIDGYVYSSDESTILLTRKLRKSDLSYFIKHLDSQIEYKNKIKKYNLLLLEFIDNKYNLNQALKENLSFRYRKTIDSILKIKEGCSEITESYRNLYEKKYVNIQDNYDRLIFCGKENLDAIISSGSLEDKIESIKISNIDYKSYKQELLKKNTKIDFEISNINQEIEDISNDFFYQVPIGYEFHSIIVNEDDWVHKRQPLALIKRQGSKLIGKVTLDIDTFKRIQGLENAQLTFTYDENNIYKPYDVKILKRTSYKQLKKDGTISKVIYLDFDAGNETFELGMTFNILFQTKSIPVYKLIIKKYQEMLELG